MTFLHLIGQCSTALQMSEQINYAPDLAFQFFFGGDYPYRGASQKASEINRSIKRYSESYYKLGCKVNFV